MAFTNGDGAEIYFETHGQGTPVIMSAGMGGSGAFWAPQVEALAARHQVILYDHVGTGRSGAGQRTIAGMADDIIAVLEHLGIDAAHVVGHAIGGITGLEAALRYPQRVRSMTVVNGWCRADAFLRRCFEVRKDILTQSGAMAYVRAQPLFLYPPQWISDNIADLEAEEAQILAHFPCAATITQRIDMFLAYDGEERLPQIRVPTLLSVARDDALVPAVLTRRLADLIPHAEIQAVDYGAHAFTKVTPDIFNSALLAFYSKVDR